MTDPEMPAWLDSATLQAMRAARDRRLRDGGDRRTAALAALEVARAHNPALPSRMIAEAAGWVIAATGAPVAIGKG